LSFQLVIVLERRKPTCSHAIAEELRWIECLNQALVYVRQTPLPAAPPHPVSSRYRSRKPSSHRAHRQSHFHHCQVSRKRKTPLDGSMHLHLFPHNERRRITGHHSIRSPSNPSDIPGSPFVL